MLISILTLITLISTSFALFLKENRTNQKDLFSTGDLTISFNDDSGDAININPAKPVSDEYGSTLDPYTFTITNTGTYKTSYQVKLVDSNSISTDAINLLKPVLKFQIDDNTPIYLRDTDNQIVVSGALSPGQTITHDLRIWIAYEATTEIANLTYKGSISLSGKAVLPSKLVSTENGDYILKDTTSGNDIQNLKLYGNTVDGNSVGESTVNLFDSTKMESGFLPQSGVYPTTNSSYPNAAYQIIDVKAGQIINITYSGSSAAQGRIRYIDNDTNQVVGPVLQETNDYYTSSVSYNNGFNDGTITAKKDFKLGVLFLKPIITIDLKITSTISNGYIIPITVSGKNLFKYINASNSSNAQVIEELENGAIMFGNNNDTSDFVYTNGWFMPGRTNVSGIGVILNEGDIVTASADVTLLDVGAEGRKLATRLYLYERETNSGYAPSNNFALTLNEKTRISNVFTITSERSGRTFFPVFSLNTHKMKIENIQIEKGSTASTYEPYQEPVTYEITLSAPLRSNGEKKDYIDFEVGKVVRWVASDGSVLSTPTEEAVTLPQIKTLNGTTVLSINTAVKPTLEGKY